jgi:hypothetical protein
MTDYLTPRGPFNTPDEVDAAAQPLRDAVRAVDPDDQLFETARARWIDIRAHHIISTLTACGVELGAQDERTARWAAATLDQPECTIFLDWVKRTRAAALAGLPVYGSIEALIEGLDDDPAEPPALSWCLYRSQPGTDALIPAGIDGDRDEAGDPVEYAREKLTEFTVNHPGWVVKVYGPDDRLLAWAQWENGKPAAYSAAAFVHALPPIDFPGRVAGVEPGPRCGAQGRTALLAADVTCPRCSALMDAEGTR